MRGSVLSESDLVSVHLTVLLDLDVLKSVIFMLKLNSMTTILQNINTQAKSRLYGSVVRCASRVFRSVVIFKGICYVHTA